jgi:hypothetical protein
MQPDTFQAGVAPGGPFTQSEVKLLICHALAFLGEPCSPRFLHEALSEDELVNYFALIEALDQLAEGEQTEYLPDTGPDGRLVALTAEGRAVAEELSTALPRSLRRRADAAILRARKRERRKAEVVVKDEKLDAGYRVTLAIPEDGGSFLEVTVFVPTADQRDKIKRRFMNNPVYIYQSILALLTGDGDIAAVPEDERLF